MFYIFVCIIYTLPVVNYGLDISVDTFRKIRNELQRNPLHGWLYKDLFTSIESLGIHPAAINRSIHFPHVLPGRLRSLFYKMLKGETINVAVLGGSISAGATLFKDKNDDKIFYHALKHYWMNTLKPITNSQIVIKNFAIGAIGSDFYSYCLENYVEGNETDLIIWELSANDYHRFDNRDVPPTLPLELLTRSIFRLEKQPALIYAHFFRGKDYKREFDCNNLEADGADYLSKYYRVPSISWRKLVCRKLMANEKFNFGKLFARDNSHPSLLGHAQMGFLLVHLIRKIFLEIIAEMLTKTPGTLLTLGIILNLQSIDPEPIPKTVFKKSDLVSEDSICFTFNLPSNGQIPINRRKVLRVLRNDGYAISTAHGFLVRKDKTEGLRSREPNKELHIQINVPQHKSGNSNEWMILIGSYSNFGGAVFFLDKKLTRVIETEKYAYGSIVAAVATHVMPGKHDLVIKSLKNGFFLSSIMLG